VVVQLLLTVLQLQLTVFIVLLKFVNGLLVLSHQLLGLDKLLVLLLPLELVLHHRRDVILHLRCHLLLHPSESLSLFVQLLCFRNDLLLLAVKTVVDVTLLPLFLQQSDRLHRPL